MSVRPARPGRGGQRCVLRWCVVALSLFCGPSYALGVMDAYALALRNDPTFRAALSERDAGVENRAIGRAGLLPNLSYSYRKARNESEVSQTTAAGSVTTERDYDSYASALTLQQPLFDYAAWAEYRQGVAKAALADERLRGRGQELVVRLFEAYSQALLAGEQIDLARAQRRAYAEQLQLNQRTFEAGEGTRTDLLETRARHDLSRAQEIEAQDALDAALRELQAIIGEPVELEQLTPLNGPLEAAPLAPARFEGWRDLAMAHNAELASQRHGLEVAEQEVERQRAGHLPTLGLYASTRKTSSDSESTYNQKYDTDSIGIQFSMPLFAGGGVSAARRQASASYDQARYELDAQRDGVLNELRRQFNLCASSTAKVRAYELAVESASGLIEATRKSVAGGERVNLDVLDAEQQLYSARRDLAEARYGYLRAWLQLRYLAGVLGEGDLQQLSRYFPAAR
ncbi:peptidase [Pseudomonas dryadis]|uniref:Peptidase n=2 Tax=Pseudomonadales TaxID=72274 RepID=A0ABY1Z3J8_9GAMM|nr:peptidase [Pseudomonas dryadis]TBV16304.1 peptidase [Pseudomonas sp. FRB 230]